MNVLLAMGIPTTADDRGYFQWLSQNWTIWVVPALVFGTLLIAWVVRKIHAWSAGTPGSNQPPAESQTMDLAEPPSPPSSTQHNQSTWMLEPLRPALASPGG